MQARTRHTVRTRWLGGGLASAATDGNTVASGTACRGAAEAVAAETRGGVAGRLETGGGAHSGGGAAHSGL